MTGATMIAATEGITGNTRTRMVAVATTTIRIQSHTLEMTRSSSINRKTGLDLHLPMNTGDRVIGLAGETASRKSGATGTEIATVTVTVTVTEIGSTGLVGAHTATETTIVETEMETGIGIRIETAIGRRVEIGESGTTSATEIESTATGAARNRQTNLPRQWILRARTRSRARPVASRSGVLGRAPSLATRKTAVDAGRRPRCGHPRVLARR